MDHVRPCAEARAGDGVADGVQGLLRQLRRGTQIWGPLNGFGVASGLIEDRKNSW